MTSVLCGAVWEISSSCGPLSHGKLGAPLGGGGVVGVTGGGEVGGGGDGGRDGDLRGGEDAAALAAAAVVLGVGVVIKFFDGLKGESLRCEDHPNDEEHSLLFTSVRSRGWRGPTPTVKRTLWRSRSHRRRFWLSQVRKPNVQAFLSTMGDARCRPGVQLRIPDWLKSGMSCSCDNGKASKELPDAVIPRNHTAWQRVKESGRFGEPRTDLLPLRLVHK
ncbi:predicted protein [Chaetomium globosum CBS 148.51]|uniref:Uncharacterized protein n=1 Tax=Chaetomium globosum (strain ATCC 6205 / CBS 148.51 / DSM 1962 / NBRC 6347 / NRRL 1970) TaxID=306901 RepID=Q2GVH3_CHAGB|nr:uncharacterized protein CHGG_08031 [Chaetomium globosum CBS 148.51]EAQ86778.1 predicted protein [Chaetomium globosum CBS 148.51]